jgi:hypothetical protein
MGVVYWARRPGHDRPVALKMILTGGLASEAEVRRFRAEAEAVAELDHSHIVPIYEVGQHGGVWYYSMKLVTGGSLSDNLPRLTADPRGGARLVATVARAVEHAHRRGILHRDLKPSNVLLDPDGTPYLTDFGLALRVAGPADDPDVDAGRGPAAPRGGDARLTRAETIVGSPPYMAPEQASGQKGATTTLSDIYGLGGILYTLLTGRLPFVGDTVRETLKRVRTQPLAPPSASNGRVDRGLEAVCLKCLEKEPSRRYSSAGALADDLERWLAGRPVEARPPAVLGQAAGWVRRRPGVATLMIALVTLGLAGALTASRRLDRAHGTANSRNLLVPLGNSDEASHRANAVDNVRATTWARLGTALNEHEGSPQDAVRYAQTLSLAERYLAAGSPSLAEEVLDASPPRRRDWEWSYLKREAAVRRARLREPADGHGAGRPGGRDQHPPAAGDGDSGVLVGDVTPVSLRAHGSHPIPAFSPDNRRLIVGDGPTLRCLDLATATVRDVSLDQGHRVRAVACSADGRVVLTGGLDATARLWDAATGRPAGPPLGHEDVVESVAFRPDGRVVLTGSRDGTARLWEAATGRPLGQPVRHSAEVLAVAFSPDGRLAASGGRDRTARLWEASTGRPTAAPLASRSEIWSLAFSPDGRLLASGGGDEAVRVWDMTNPGKQRMVLRHPAAVRHVAFSPDGRRLVSAGTDRAVKLWDVSSGQELLTLRGHSDEALAAVFSPDGRRLATSGRDGTIRIWDAPFLPRSDHPLGGRLPRGDSPGMPAEVKNPGD